MTDIETNKYSKYSNTENTKLLGLSTNTGLVSSGASLTSWGEGASLALAGHPPNDGVTIKIPYEIDAASHPTISYWVG